VVIAVFVVVNLFIAVVLNNLENAKDEEKAEVDATPSASRLAGAHRTNEKRPRTAGKYAAQFKSGGNQGHAPRS
jgi:hypothetical protein